MVQRYHSKIQQFQMAYDIMILSWCDNETDIMVQHDLMEQHLWYHSADLWYCIPLSYDIIMVLTIISQYQLLYDSANYDTIGYQLWYQL